jgi:superkiller protein 3
MDKKEGVLLEDYCYAAGELLLAAGALDHAEKNFGSVLMVNPFNVAAMTRLARVWFLKGFTAEADRILDRARELAPNDDNVAKMQEEFRETERAWQDNQPQLTITPPSPDWLRYVLSQVCRPSLRREIVALSNEADPNDAVIQLEAMICLIEDKEYEAAARKAPMVHSCLPGNAYACAVVSRAYAYAGYVEPAIQWGRRAVSLDTQSELAWGSLALALALQEKPDATSRELMNAIAQHPTSASVFYYKLGLQKRSTSNNKEAAELFEKALQAQPNDAKALQALGETLLALSEFEQASKVLQKALAVNPGDAKTYGNLGYALLNQGKSAEAAEALRTAVELDPESAVYHSDLAVCLARLNREAEAIQEFRRAIELDPKSASAHYKLANTLVSMGRLPEAVAEYREVIKIVPAQHYVHFNLGTVLHRLGKLEEAINEFHEEIRHNPKFADAYVRLARLYREKGENDLSRDVVERAAGLGIKIDPVTLEPLGTVRPDEKK